MNEHLVWAQRGANSAINRWLGEHPVVLGAIFVALGLLMLGYGVHGLATGVSRDKYGNEIKGGLGKVASAARVIAGVVACAFGVYKMIAG